MNLESRGTQFLSSSDLRFTDEDLQAKFTGDILGEYIYQMADLTLRWGGFSVTIGTWTGGAGNQGQSSRNGRSGRR